MPEEKKPKANAPRCYAVERLAVIRSEIIRSSAEMLTERAKVEKYREVDPAKAQESYLKLKTVRKRLLEDLRESQLCLLEVEESALARVAGKLSQGLSGFQLMSRSYRRGWIPENDAGSGCYDFASVCGRMDLYGSRKANE